MVVKEGQKSSGELKLEKPANAIVSGIAIFLFLRIEKDPIVNLSEAVNNASGGLSNANNSSMAISISSLAFSV